MTILDLQQELDWLKCLATITLDQKRRDEYQNKYLDRLAIYREFVV